jgi:hypothetical protein
LICNDHSEESERLYAGKLLNAPDQPTSTTGVDQADDYIPTSKEPGGFASTTAECEPLAPGQVFEARLAHFALRKSDFCPTLPSAYTRVHHRALKEAIQGSGAAAPKADRDSPLTLKSVAEDARGAQPKSRAEMLLLAVAWEIYALHFYADLFAGGHQVATAPVENSLWAPRRSQRTIDYWNRTGVPLQGRQLRQQDSRYQAFVALATSKHFGCDRSAAWTAPDWNGYGSGRLDDPRNRDSRCRLAYGAARSMLSVLETYVTGEHPPPNEEFHVRMEVAPYCMQDRYAKQLALEATPPLANEIVFNASFSGLSGLFQKYSLQYSRLLAEHVAVSASAGTLSNPGRAVFKGRGWFAGADVTLYFANDPNDVLFYYARLTPYFANLSPDVGFGRYEGSAVSLGYGTCMRLSDYLGMSVHLELVGELRQSPEAARSPRLGIGGAVIQGLCF